MIINNFQLHPFTLNLLTHIMTVPKNLKTAIDGTLAEP